MPYDITLVQVNASSFGFSKSSFVGFSGAPFDCMLFSMWACLPTSGSSGSSGGPGYTSFFNFTVQGITASLSLLNGPSTTMFSGTFPAPIANIRSNLLLSVRCSTQTVQLYINDRSVALSSGGWLTTGSFNVNSTNVFAFDVGSSFGIVYPAFADLWCNKGDASGNFVDLSVVSNRRKFINANLSPVDLGTSGQNPFGSPPVIFETVPAAGVADDFLTNRGTGSSPFVLNGSNFLTLETPGTCRALTRSFRPMTAMLGKTIP